MVREAQENRVSRHFRLYPPSHLVQLSPVIQEDLVFPTFHGLLLLPSCQEYLDYPLIPLHPLVRLALEVLVFQKFREVLWLPKIQAFRVLLILPRYLAIPDPLLHLHYLGRRLLLWNPSTQKVLFSQLVHLVLGGPFALAFQELQLILFSPADPFPRLDRAFQVFREYHLFPWDQDILYIQECLASHQVPVVHLFHLCPEDRDIQSTLVLLSVLLVQNAQESLAILNIQLYRFLLEIPDSLWHRDFQGCH